MMPTSRAAGAPEEPRVAASRARASPRRPPLRVILPAVVILGYALAALLGDVVAPYDPFVMNTADRLEPPGALLQTGEITWLGTDQLGRSLLAQIIAGARISLMVGTASLSLAMLIGLTVGVAAGYAGGRLDGILMRIADIQLAFPSILLAIFLSAFFEPSLLSVILVLAITRWVAFARVGRAVTLLVNHLDYVDSARVVGASHARILRTCILPALISPLLVVATAELGLIIIAEASLSFLGLGPPPTTPSWGLTIAEGRQYLVSAWWITAMPGLALALLVLNTGILGDALRDWLDPKSA